jgi:hypothetical protein
MGQRGALIGLVQTGEGESFVRLCFDIHFHDTDLRLVGPKEGAQAFEDDRVIVDERDANRFGHATRILPHSD